MTETVEIVCVGLLLQSVMDVTELFFFQSINFVCDQTFSRVALVNFPAR